MWFTLRFVRIQHWSHWSHWFHQTARFVCFAAGNLSFFELCWGQSRLLGPGRVMLNDAAPGCTKKTSSWSGASDTENHVESPGKDMKRTWKGHEGKMIVNCDTLWLAVNFPGKSQSYWITSYHKNQFPFPKYASISCLYYIYYTFTSGIMVGIQTGLERAWGGYCHCIHCSMWGTRDVWPLWAVSTCFEWKVETTLSRCF
jgi:hypothetical protein